MTHYPSCEAAMRDAARGNAKALIWCFVWWRQPEGEAYWSRQYIRDSVSPIARHRLRLRLRKATEAKRKAKRKLPRAVGLAGFLVGPMNMENNHV